MSARILIIEDNPANLELMTYLLRAYGHDTFEALDGETGLQIIKHKIPDLILCDVRLPGISGYEIARQLKDHQAMSQIPLVAVSAYAMVGDRDVILSAGFDGYIAKPIAPETFVSQVEAFLPQDQRTGVRPPEAVSGGKTGPRPAFQATLLVVDNRPENLAVLRAMLEPFGYEVISAHTVSGAMALARQSKPDLILSDVFLGGESGHELLTAAKADPALKEVPFLFISSTSWAEHDAAYALKEGADAYITRPLEPNALLAHVRRWVKKNEQ